jgi:predicted small lipoprotein YifL
MTRGRPPGLCYYFFIITSIPMRTLLALLTAVTLAAGCGYKGPLYLPESKPAPKEKPATKKPAPPQEEKKPDA